MSETRRPSTEPELRELRWFDWRVLPPLAGSAAFLWFLLGRMADPSEVVQVVAGARWEYAGLALLTLFASLLVGTNRWRMIVVAMGYPLSMGAALRAVLAAWPFAFLTPSRAGDLVRAVSIRSVVPPLAGVGSIIAEKFIDVQALCLLTVVGGALTGGKVWIGVAVGLSSASWLVFALVLRAESVAMRIPGLRRVAPKIGELVVAFAALRRRPGQFVGVAVSSLVSWLLAIGLLQSLLLAVGAKVSALMTLSLWPLAMFAGQVPVTLAGMGTRDAAFLYLLHIEGFAPGDDAAVLSATMGYSLLGTVLLAVLGIPFAMRLSMELTARRRTASEPGIV